ncbi:MAG: aminopeptidase [Melioribacteraceae bacterium]|nr:aminopeptidase [Melioribacteraceae bacterium]
MAITKLDKACVTAIKDCMGAKKKESVLIVTDENKREIGYAMYHNALKLGHETLLVEMKAREINGEEPPKNVAELMKKFDVVLCPTTKSLTHTDARREASALGVRIATFPGITEDVLVRGLNADYKKIAALTLKLKKLMEKTKIVRVTAPNGTDITMDISKQKIIPSKGLFHKKGESGNLPTGEAFCAPVEGSAEGVFVVDGSMAGIGVLEKSTITIEVKKGMAVKISGGKEAKKLETMLDKVGKKARNIAELGIGTNDKAKLSGLILEDEKVKGTVHIALGNNVTMGGSVNVPIHLDGVIKKPTLYFDGKEVMKNGKLLVK